jgi:hypothetical protein
MQGWCVGIARNYYRTLVKWANNVCKKRIAFRLKEKKSGVAEISPPTVLDTVAGDHLLHLFFIWRLAMVAMVMIETVDGSDGDGGDGGDGSNGGD